MQALIFCFFFIKKKKEPFRRGGKQTICNISINITTPILLFLKLAYQLSKLK